MAERMPAHAALGRAVARWRKQHGMSQEELGAKAGLHRTFVGAIERAEKSVTLATIDKLLDGTRLTLPELAELIERERDRERDESKPDESKPDESKPDESKPDESKPDESEPDESEPG